ncbi:hypothetical protein AQUCO_03300131v1 [Aquilegia coerulea]|uniref:Uncharacterized protein n=1 Tax=Aquilegia coerulea TaxID=218851 RepID=A0A2G5CZM6_AQUCA|nr:hypothetical protein AQUCO_03300131v1 [Aquilegia coerulea]
MREYNSANAFTSLGVQMDDRVLGGRGPRPFTIHGELHHRTGSLLPDQDQRPSTLNCTSIPILCIRHSPTGKSRWIGIF